MTYSSATDAGSLVSVREKRERLEGLRARARRLFLGGATGVQVTAMLADGLDAFLLDVLKSACEALPGETFSQLQRETAVVAVGGTGRGDPAPYSDVDLLFLHSESAPDVFAGVTSQIVRDCWDAGLNLGHAVRTVPETVALARDEPEVATSLIDARLLWGSSSLFARLLRRFEQRLLGSRWRRFLDVCVKAREEERLQFGGSVLQLEPHVKKSLGGLRDVHLIRWLGFAVHRTTDLDALRWKGFLRNTEARQLRDAYEFLLRLRCDLHFANEKAQDQLTREEQLRIAEERGIRPPLGQRPVEAFMRSYFQQASAVARLARRLAARYQPRPLRRRLMGFLTSHRLNNVLKVTPFGIDLAPRHVGKVCGRLEDVLGLFRLSAWHQVPVSPRLIDLIARQERRFEGTVSQEAARLFLDILRRPGFVGPTLRALSETGILEHVVPAFAHARCLLQFNQYHNYTVDEHTLRAVEAAEAFEEDEGPLGTAYRALRHKEILHLALLLHDLGKGFEEDHSEVGRAIAETTAQRLFLPDHHRETLVFLVHRHLRMSHLALRRDCSDAGLLMEFAREVGSPETLRMLYVLTAADLSAVGPGVLTGWKTELLSDLYDRAMMILSGKPYRYHEEQRLEEIREEVRRRLGEDIPQTRDAPENDEEWISRQLESFSPHYLSNTPPDQVAGDLRSLRHLAADEIDVTGQYDPETQTVEYRVLVGPQRATGCFHRITGALTAKRLEILSAQICTTAEGMAVDRFRVMDDDYAGPVPAERIAEVGRSIRDALQPGSSVAHLFRRFQRYGENRPVKPVSDQQTRVVIDNDSSEQCTVIDVFAHDRRGLLYTLTRCLHELNLSVMLAKISTHLDQVIDVFYVTDAHGKRIQDGERLKTIRLRLLETIEQFEQDGYRRFLS